ncbi:MAG: undecaprenyl-diphosphate phosphatase [Acidimicrobiia bacterium]|nr:undecaprenyl-diphosphate phosphatase [Acidimicrobiia bacterium]MDH5294544.1 undecaprenyl-diphosphate phosphatase [Acidimicrobiia bacterium]
MEQSRTPWITAAIVIAVITALAVLEAGDVVMSVPEALLIGIVEGVTEFLPISSTGHLAVTEQLLGLTSTPEAKAAADAYAIVIQAGAIVAVLGLYRRRIGTAIAAIAGRGPDVDAGRRLLAALIGGFVPAAIVGLLFSDFIKENLFGLWPVVAAWIAGGVVILVWKKAAGHRPLETLGLKQGLIIGIAQVAAVWPGTSRSLVTILAALALGYSMSAAVEFSFLLGLVTLGAATAYEALTSGDLIVSTFGIGAPAAGFAAAFVSAAVAVKWMVAYLRTRSLDVFGWYRIAVGILVGSLALSGVI